MTNVVGQKAMRKQVITEEEFLEGLRRADEIYKDEFLRMRAKALWSLLYIVGKRISEVITLEINDIEVLEDRGLLRIAFLVEKKRTTLALARKKHKLIRLSNPYIKYFLEYYEYIKKLGCRYVFPSGRQVNLRNYRDYIVDCSRPMTRQTAWKIVVSLGPMTWPHLFRETKAAKIVKKYGNDIKALYEVKRALDLKTEKAAWAYIDRYGEHLIDEDEPID